ncbi:hypothetical protein TUM4445_12080 [Shewanella sp. MBTL60-112-B2]|nr:hypothetical protein TUM4444_24000 [Shewanella sp. MBTL60-112-B1]GIU29624.1 hypothetical protein TUM4445_12080 [Shewanella sp. MBTL60-112-B2]
MPSPYKTYAGIGTAATKTLATIFVMKSTAGLQWVVEQKNTITIEICYQ